MKNAHFREALPFLFQKNVAFWRSFALFCLLNIGLYVCILTLHSVVAFSSFYSGVNRFLPDPRISSQPFQFLRSLNQTDAQWYMHIAEFGYPHKPNRFFSSDITSFDGLAYDFFPLFPIVIHFINSFFHNIELSGFVFNNTLLLLNFCSLYALVISLGYNSKTATKTCLLFFFYPFSIFFRSYFSESLFVFLSLWFYFYFSKKNYLPAAVFLAFLVITRGSALFFLPVFWFYSLKEHKSRKKALFSILLTVFPLSFWVAFNFVQTGNPLYFFTTRSLWIPTSVPFRSPFLLNIAIFAQFFSLPTILSPYNKIDVLLIIFVGFIIYHSRKMLSKKMWLLGTLLWGTPLLFASTMSVNRYMSVIFQPYLYIVQKLPEKLFWILFAIGYILLNIVALFFVNAYWIG